MKHSSLSLLMVAFLGGCAAQQQAATVAGDSLQRRDTEIELEGCDVSSSNVEKIDANADGQAELIKVLDGQREICRAADLNFDGRVDRTSYFSDGVLRRVESDFDRDGVVDEIALFKQGKVNEKHRVTTLDGKLDTWDFFGDGQIVRTERDVNGDGVIDQWWEYPSRECPLIHVDTDGDGRPNPGSSIDYCKETGFVPTPLPSEISQEKASFGASEERVEELSNSAQGAESTQDATGSQKAAAVPSANEEKSQSEEK